MDDFGKTLSSIAILGGTGNEGPGLALRWANAGYKIIIGSRQKIKAKRIADELNKELGINTIIGMENTEAARYADICVLTVAQSAHLSMINSLKGVLNGKILIDTTARLEFPGPKPPNPPAAAKIAQDILGIEAHVVAAFQNVSAHVLRKNINQPIDADVLVCADDKKYAQEVIDLAEAGGMKAYYAGDLENAIVIEGLTSLLINLNRAYKCKSAGIRISGIKSRAK